MYLLHIYCDIINFCREILTFIKPVFIKIIGAFHNKE